MFCKDQKHNYNKTKNSDYLLHLYYGLEIIDHLRWNINIIKYLNGLGKVIGKAKGKERDTN